MANRGKNTTAKGDAFEEKIFKITNSFIEKGEIPVNKGLSKVFLKKKYETKDNPNGVIIDVSIETYSPDSKEISILTIIECKDYASAVDIGEIREFNDKIKEVGAQKGYLFATSCFQDGARAKAKANHIGLAVVHDFDDYKWITRRIAIRDKEETISNIIKTLTGSYNGSDFAFAAEGKDYYTNYYDFLHEDVGLPIKQTFSIDYLTNDSIIDKLHKELNLSQNTHTIISDNDLLQFISDRNYSVKPAALKNKVLGEIDFDKKIVYFSDILEVGCPRWRFTIAHELGHIILHADSIIRAKIEAIEECLDDEKDDSCNVSDKTITKMEIQANLFASYLLLPKDAFIAEYYRLFKTQGIRNFPYLVYDEKPWNMSCYNFVLNKLSTHFNVSKAVIINRLKELDFLRS